jgi:xylulokinase
VSNAVIELYDTDGAVGAARAAGMGIGFYQILKKLFLHWKKLLS